MAAAVDRYFDQLEAEDRADRRNGYYRRHLLTELGDIELNVPRTRRYSPVAVIRAYARRAPEIDRVILAGFVLGLSTRKVGETLLVLLGRAVSPSTVSQVAKTLDTAVAAFHRRPLQNRYKALMLDGVVLSRKTGAPAARSAARCFAQRFHDQYPQAVACLRNDLDELLTCFRYKIEAERRAVRTPHRTPLSRSQTKDTANGHLPGQNQHGSHLIRRLHPRKPITRRQYPFPADTEQLTLPMPGQ